MYGTVARLRVKPGAAENLKQMSSDQAAYNIPGFVFEYLYQMDKDARDFVLVVGFTDKAAYVKNAESPEQNAEYQKLRALLEADPEWNDGEIVDSHSRTA